jgi:uncharacterized protein (TIGR02246 family)
MTIEADQAAIAALTQKVVASWAYQDAEGFASVFVDDGTMILAGCYCEGRAEIESYMAEAFTGRYKGTQVVGKPLSMRFLSKDIAILLSLGGVLESGATEVDRDSAIRASWLAARQDDGQWRLVAYQNTPRYPAATGGSAHGRAA